MAVRKQDGRVVVFGDSFAPPVTLSDAVAASCAVPGYFKPTVIGGVEYVDGGIRSSTNADLMCGQPVDTVVVISPLSSLRGAGWSLTGILRAAATRALRREIQTLEEWGYEVRVVEPGPEALAAMGNDLMSDVSTPRIVREGFFDVGRELSRIPEPIGM